MGNKLVSLCGLLIFICIAWALSNNRKFFPWRTVLCGLALQFGFAVFILQTAFGQRFFGYIQLVFNKLLDAANQGAMFVFGPLATSAIMNDKFGSDHAFIFVISVTSSIVIVSALSSFFYHYGILQRIVHFMAIIMQKTMRTSGSESLAAGVNMFVGQDESALVIKLYLAGMTASELFALMTIGMATIASGVMITYAQLGMSAGHLLTASVMSAPGALLIAKIMFPETERSETTAAAKLKTEKHTVNGIDALCRGAGDGMMLAINVMAMVMAFVAIVWLVNFSLGWMQRKFGVDHPLTMQVALGWINAPFAWLMGVPWHDCQIFGQLLSERILLNEFISYLDLSSIIHTQTMNGQPAALSPRSITLATYALCGFANFSSIAIQIGGIGTIAPTRRSDLARYGFRAMIGGLISCYLSATIAGLLIP
ncbi:MAG TPA: nucleoside transporter C-terminal domain-containing protein [Verrucomicrobiae bacterium]|jgi:CNT family concentrative nucleoside transporter|nr:nucleoside transporter C-terminal domain-containing protein [Verrucomicrobiae bacterium]